MIIQRLPHFATTLVTLALCTTGRAADFPITLNYNFNGMAHSGEEFNADNPDGFRSISDRALHIDGQTGSFGAVPIVGSGGIPYQIVTAAGALDIVHVGDRNTTDNGNWAFDATPDGDNIGTQPNWLSNPDQTGPQATSLTALNLTLDPSAEIGVLYQVSNGGGNFRVTLSFTDSTSVFVTCNAPDWFQNQSPGAPGNGLIVQHQLGVFNGTDGNDIANSPAATLNVAEAIISVSEMLNDGVGDVRGKTLASISFSDRSRPTAAYAILAATVRTGLGPPANDQCANCTPMSEGTVTGSSARATGTDLTACGNNDTTDVWFCYTATATGRAEARTCGSQFDTTLAVFDTCSGPAIVCDDNACGLASLVQWNATANHTYRIRIAGVGATVGDYTLTVINPAQTFNNRPLPLAFNFNGMAHIGESGNPDDPAGFRSISDRALSIDGGLASFASGGVLGTTGISYSPIRTDHVLDIIHLGDRNTLDPWDAVPDGDNVGIQPTWLPNSDQTGPQVSDVSALHITLGAQSEMGVLFNVSNGGGGFNCTLGFTDSTSVTVFLAGPDWFGSQTPITPDPGVAVQTQLGVYTGTGDTDSALPSLPLNVQESIVSVQSLIGGGLGDVTGKTLATVTFSNPDTANGYGIYAVTVRSPGLPPCPGDLNGDRAVGLQDLTILLSHFGTASGASPADGDMNGDGDVDLGDLTAFLSNFGNVCS